jgi:hypothetical protein
MAFTYGGKFEKHINELYRPENIADTARKFKEFESKNGPYTFGDNFTKTLVPKPEDWGDANSGYNTWEQNSGGIPESIRKQITEVISANLRSANPLPLVLKVGENVDATHELIVKAFAYGGQIYIGLHILCPNSALG